MKSITPVLLAGGAGQRLWPVSRQSYPKQFSEIFGAESLYQRAARRLSSSNKANFEPPLTVTTKEFRFMVAQQLRDVGVASGDILIEPEAKNTAPAILSACLISAKKNKDSIMLVVPSDHLMPDIEAFHEAVVVGLPKVLNGQIVTFGITPTRPETGYGYLEVDASIGTDAISVKSFVEKPDQSQATKMLKARNYLWNAGIFMFKAQAMIESYKLHAPELIEPVNIAVEKASSEAEFTYLFAEAWQRCNPISFDYAILEKVGELFSVPFSKKWSDVGSWDAVWSEMGPDDRGVSLSENANAFDCKNILLRSESETQQIVGFGLDNILAVAMPDAVLIANKDKAQEVKVVVEKLKAKGIQQSELFPKHHRPWGWFESLVLSDDFQVKRIFVYPNAALSLQSHKHRSEHWVLVEGQARVTIDKEIETLTEGQSVYVPVGAIHRLENTTEKPIVLIEVQIGNYLGEDDIVRYEDLYSRL